ncbi:large ribosomal subunit protein uL18m-like [Glandiceps talaboti]
MISVTQRSRFVLMDTRMMLMRSSYAGMTKCPQTMLPKESVTDTCIKCVRYSTEAAQQESNEGEVQRSENDRVTTDFINRNPRNLERMAVAYKDAGWILTHPRRNYWHKLFLEQSLRHITAYVEHINGHHVISASSKEWSIKKQLYSCSDVAACYNVGRVIAQRCLEAGISCVKWEVPELIDKTDKIKKFESALKEEGLLLSEPRTLEEPVDYFPDIDHDESTKVDLDSEP